MPGIIIASGQTEEKFLNFLNPNDPIKVTPFISMECGGALASFRVGFSTPRPKRDWSLELPTALSLIQAYRAMKLLERVGCIETMGDSAGKKTRGDTWYLDNLRVLCPSYKNFNAVRSAVASLKPSDEEFKKMLGIVKERKLGISMEEAKSIRRESGPSLRTIVEELRLIGEAREKEIRQAVATSARLADEQKRMPRSVAILKRQRPWQQLFG